MLNYESEIRKPAEIKSEFTKTQATPRKLRLAEELIAKWHDKEFDFSEYNDTYRQKVQKAIKAKAKGKEIAAPEEEEPEVINLMDALQRSVGRIGAKSQARSPRNGHKKKGKPKKKGRKVTAAHRRRA
jgi:DNA end-binding protein Ku